MYRNRKSGVEGERMPQTAVVVGGEVRLWIEAGLSSWRLEGFTSDSSVCITDPTLLSAHTHPSPYYSSCIQKPFPTGKVKAPLREHFVAILCLLLRK